MYASRTSTQFSVGKVVFYVFERSLLCSQRLHLLDKSTVKTVILWNIINILSNFYT